MKDAPQLSLHQLLSPKGKTALIKGVAERIGANKFIIVSNRLPISVKKENGTLVFTPSAGGLATAMSSVQKDDTTLWIGWPGIASDDLTANDKRVITKKLLGLRCAPVFLSRQQIDEYYDGYANGVIWPLFHYFQHHVSYDKKYWDAYRQVNRLFQTVVLRHADSAATIWVHDYHLMLLPRLLRQSLPASAIGFFLHIPFPSYEIFRLLPNRIDILQGILGATLVGFHTYDYVRHFTSSVQRIVGYENKIGSITGDGHIIQADAFPIGIDYDKFAQTALGVGVAAEMKKIRHRYEDQRIIISIDRLDYSKGISERLEAFGLLLERYPDYRGKVTLVVIAVPSRTDVAAYKQLRDSIELTVSRINGTYATADWSPISYRYSNLPFDEIVALYSIADIALITPLRDGMNLVAKEFIASKQTSSGVLILSEMAGAAAELPEALRVNPYDASAIAAALVRALEMPLAQQKRALRAMQSRVSHYSVERWADDFTKQLAVAHRQEMTVQKIHLDAHGREVIADAFVHAKKRLFLLDYDGTLRGFVSSPEIDAARPSSRVLAALAALSSQPNTIVCIISGRPKAALEEWFGDLSITLIAEHGAWIRDGAKWMDTDNDFRRYKPTLRPILERYAERTPGAVIEEKDSALVWHYRNVTPELAFARNAHLRHDLATTLNGSDVGLFDGNKIIEIKPYSVNKGTVVKMLIKQHKADFVFCAGDDYTDEDMFHELPKSAWTVKVGAGDTRARYQVDGVDDIVDQLEQLANR